MQPFTSHFSMLKKHHIIDFFPKIRQNHYRLKHLCSECIIKKTISTNINLRACVSQITERTKFFLTHPIQLFLSLSLFLIQPFARDGSPRVNFQPFIITICLPCQCLQKYKAYHRLVNGTIEKKFPTASFGCEI